MSEYCMSEFCHDIGPSDNAPHSGIRTFEHSQDRKNDHGNSNCSILRNRILISDIQTVNNTQSTNIASNLVKIDTNTYNILMNTQDINSNSALITGIQSELGTLYSANNTQNGRLTAIETKTQNMTITNGDTEFSTNVIANNTTYGKISMLQLQIDNLNNAYKISVNTSNITDLQTSDVTQKTRLTNLETVNTTQTNDITSINNLNNTQNTRLSYVEFLNTAQNTRLTNLEMAPSSKYTGSFNTTGMTIPNAINVWDTLNMDTLPTAYVGGSPNAPAGRNRIRLTTARVYKIIFSFTYASVSGNESDWNITHRMRLNTVDSTTYTPIIASRIFDLRGSGDCCNGADYTSMNSDNLILYSNTANDWIMQYRTRTDSSGNTRPNRFNLCVSFSHSGVTSDYFLQTYSSQTRSMVDCRYVLTYEAY
jgi:hypothetical protein